MFRLLIAHAGCHGDLVDGRGPARCRWPAARPRGARRCAARGWSRSPCAASAAAASADRASSARRCRSISAPSRATRKSRPGVNSSSASSQGAETSGMPQASASKTRMVGMPGSASHVGPARDVDRHPEAREDLAAPGSSAASRRTRSRPPPARPAPARDSARRRPAPAARARCTGSNRNSCSSAVRSSSPQLPIQTRSPSARLLRQRVEDAGVRGLVPGPGALRPAALAGRCRA